MIGGGRSKFRERVYQIENVLSFARERGCARVQPQNRLTWLKPTRPEHRMRGRACPHRRATESHGQVAEWSKAADCKSADPCGLRRFEPSPVHRKNSDKRRARAGGQCRLLSTHLIPLLVTEVRGGSNSMVESQPSKLLVAGSIPVSRSKKAVKSEK